MNLLNITNDGVISWESTDGSVWKTSGPFLILRYYDRQHPRAQTVAAPSGDGYAFGTAGTPSLGAKGKISVTKLDGSEFKVCADFPNIQIRMEFRIFLNCDASGFSVRCENDGVTEGMPSLYRVLGFELLPHFGAAKTGESGYLTLPNWSGQQTFFNKSYPREAHQTIYSSNDQWENGCNMPVFGITRSHGTLCGLVAAGDFDAQLICRVHWEQDQINSVHPYLVYRWEQQDERLSGPREVRYSFAPALYEGGEGYVFCAKVYREFLRRERGLLSWEEKAKTRPVVLDYRDRFFLKIFMAYKSPQADGHGPYHITCSFAEVRRILEDCLSRGMSKLCVMLVGWGQDGHDGMPPKRFPVDERLGGESAFKELIAWCKEHDILLGVHDNYGESYSCSPEFDKNDVIQHRSGERWQGVIWSGGQVHKVCPAVYVDKHTRRDIASVRALGLYGHHHLDAVGGFVTCFDKAHPVERRADFIREVRRMFELVTKEMGSVSTEMPFGQYFDVVDGFFHTHTRPGGWFAASPIGRYFADRSVPLLPIVLHGSVNCGESVDDLRESPLRWLDWGLTPEWEVCMHASETFGIPAYTAVADTLACVYQRYFGESNLLGRLNNLWIEGRWEEKDGVTRTLYSDGTAVQVNSGSEERMGIPPQSCRIIQPK